MAHAVMHISFCGRVTDIRQVQSCEHATVSIDDHKFVVGLTGKLHV